MNEGGRAGVESRKEGRREWKLEREKEREREARQDFLCGRGKYVRITPNNFSLTISNVPKRKKKIFPGQKKVGFATDVHTTYMFRECTQD